MRFIYVVFVLYLSTFRSLVRHLSPLLGCLSTLYWGFSSLRLVSFYNPLSPLLGFLYLLYFFFSSPSLLSAQHFRLFISSSSYYSLLFTSSFPVLIFISYSILPSFNLLLLLLHHLLLCYPHTLNHWIMVGLFALEVYSAQCDTLSNRLDRAGA